MTAAMDAPFDPSFDQADNAEASPAAHVPAPVGQVRELIDQSDIVPYDDIRANTKQWSRTAVFKLLLQCFALQIRYGCENDACTTPTCFSFRKRFDREPVRRPTPLTARDQAFVLAGTDNPLSHLCPSPLRTDIDGDQRVDVEQVKAYIKWELENGEPAIFKKRMRELGVHFGISDGETEQEKETLGPVDEDNDHHPQGRRPNVRLDSAGFVQSKLDNSSLVQNLFNSKTMRDIFGAKEPTLQDNDRSKARDEKSIEFNLSAVPYSANEFKKALATYNGRQNMVRVENRPVADLHSILVTKPSISIATMLTPPILVSDVPFFPESSRLRARRIAHFVFLSLRHGLSTPMKLVEQWCSPGPPLNFADFSHLRLRKIEDTDGNTVSSICNLNVSIGDISAALGLMRVTGSDTLDSLWHGLDAVFTPPLEITKRTGTEHPTGISGMEYINDEEAARVIYVTISILVGSLPVSNPIVLDRILESRRSGQILPNKGQKDMETHVQYIQEQQMLLGVSDAFESEPAIRLAEKLVSALAVRRSHWYAMRELRGETTEPESKVFPVMFMVMAHLTACFHQAVTPTTANRGPIYEAHRLHSMGLSPAPILLEWLRTVFRIAWDGKCVLSRWKGAGAVLDIMNDIYQFRHREANWGLNEPNFELSTLSTHLKAHKIIPDYLLWMETNHPGSKRHKNERHLLQYPFVFESLRRTRYFRLMLYHQMYQEWQVTRATRELHGHFSWLIEPDVSEYQCPDTTCNHAMCERLRFLIRQRRRWAEAGYEPGQSFPSNFWNRDLYLRHKLKNAEAKFLVLDIERQTVLESAFNQLWGREQWELLKPLKVVMRMDGKDEDAADHGGVSQEFFRLVLGKAFDPEYGLFVITEEQTRMNWFQPLSSEPLQTYELLGLLFGMAVYNSITLPLNFPAAMYQILCGRGPMESFDIHDAWPALHKSFQQLASWSEEQGDVEEVFARDFAFSFEANGITYTIDMLEDPNTIQWPKTPCHTVPEAWMDDSRNFQPVTNANRLDFISKYKEWLVHHSVKPQLDAFVKGFRQMIPAPFTSYITGPSLQRFVEGTRHIDVQQLRAATSYALPPPSPGTQPTYADDYSSAHPTIRHFWSVVEKYDQEQLKKLLTFVTASDRVPVQGYRAIGFSIEKHGDTGMLPTSSTCFGKLFLPAYESREVLERMLRVAVEEGMVGFGFM